MDVPLKQKMFAFWKDEVALRKRIRFFVLVRTAETEQRCRETIFTFLKTYTFNRSIKRKKRAFLYNTILLNYAQLLKVNLFALLK